MTRILSLLLLPGAAYFLCRRRPFLAWSLSAFANAGYVMVSLAQDPPEPEMIILAYLWCAIIALFFAVELAFLHVPFHDPAKVDMHTHERTKFVIDIVVPAIFGWCVSGAFWIGQPLHEIVVQCLYVGMITAIYAAVLSRLRTPLFTTTVVAGMGSGLLVGSLTMFLAQAFNLTTLEIVAAGSAAWLTGGAAIAGVCLQCAHKQSKSNLRLSPTTDGSSEDSGF